MGVEQVETLIIGGGQAGLAMSEQLTMRSLPHLVVERHRIVERWRSERWDGLHANGPAWSDSMPGYPIPGVPLDAFATRDQIVDYFVAYADAIRAPVRCGVEVTVLTQRKNGAGFHADTSRGPIEAANVIAATGPFQRPVIPALVPPDAGVFQVHGSAYRNPGALPEGAVLVVGAGSSGAQIADELMRAGRRVYLSVGHHIRPPRRYRRRDFVWWMDQQGLWHLPLGAQTPAHTVLAFSGAYGGVSVDYRRLATQGLVLVGRAEAYRDGVMSFAQDLATNLAMGDASCLAFCDQADAFAAQLRLDLPEEPEARGIPPDPPCVVDPIRELRLRDAGIGCHYLGHGLRARFWLAQGSGVRRTRHARAPTGRDVSARFCTFWGSHGCPNGRRLSFCGVGHDAARLADHIAARARALVPTS